MIVTFIFEAGIGCIGILSVLLLGPKGGVVLALIALLPFMKREKSDEEDKAIFKKVNVFSILVFIVLLFILYIAADVTVNGRLLGDSVIQLAGLSLLLAHGMVGLFFLKDKLK